MCIYELGLQALIKSNEQVGLNFIRARLMSLNRVLSRESGMCYLIIERVYIVMNQVRIEFKNEWVLSGLSNRLIYLEPKEPGTIVTCLRHDRWVMSRVGKRK
jgi:hypothetical protein